MNKTVFIIPQLIDKLSRKVDRLNKRAAKLNLTPVDFNVKADRFITVCKPNGTTVRKIRVDLSCNSVQLKGWEYLGSIRKLSNGEVLVSHDAPEQYRATPTACDHCKTNRRRAVTVALRNTESGETVQVGRSCLADYLDDSNAVALADWLEKVDKVAEETEQAASSGGGYGRAPRPETFSFMAYVSAVMVWNEGTYIPGGTRGHASRDYYGDKIDKYDDRPRVTPDDSDNKAAREIVAWVRNLEGVAGYLANLKAALASDIIPYKAIGLAASAFQAKKNADLSETERKEKEEAKAAREAAREEAAQRGAASEHFGTVKVRDAFNLTVTACRQFEVDGYAYPYHPETKTAVSMTDEDGNNAVWFACGAKDYRTGETFKVKATVKRHGTDRDGNKQTVLTRCTFPKGSEAEAE